MTKVHTDRIDQGFVLGNQVLVAEVFAKNGFLVLSSVTGEDKTADANADQISQGKEDDDSRQIEHPLDHSTRLSPVDRHRANSPRYHVRIFAR